MCVCEHACLGSGSSFYYQYYSVTVYITVVLMMLKRTECIVFENIASSHIADVCQRSGCKWVAAAECKHDIT